MDLIFHNLLLQIATMSGSIVVGTQRWELLEINYYKRYVHEILFPIHIQNNNGYESKNLNANCINVVLPLEIKKELFEVSLGSLFQTEKKL